MRLGAGGPVVNDIGFVVIGLFMAFCIIMALLQLRRGGPGPAVNYIPKGLRPSVNAYYRNHGWQEPFDADGNRNPMRDQV
jgi:hypothetical protein